MKEETIIKELEQLHEAIYLNDDYNSRDLDRYAKLKDQLSDLGYIVEGKEELIIKKCLHTNKTGIGCSECTIVFLPTL